MELTTSIAAAPEAVWDIITDLDRTPERLSRVEQVERVAGGQEFAPGVRWRETRRMFGGSHTEEMEILEVDEGRSYLIGSEGGGAVYRTRLAVTPSAQGAELTMRFDSDPQGLGATIISKVTAPLITPLMRKALRQDLADIKAAAEGAAA